MRETQIAKPAPAFAPSGWTMVTSHHRYLYAIDEADRITQVSSGWLAFAQENGAVELTQSFVIGKRLWEFIEGSETQALYASILDRVRTKVPYVVVPFRCDSPTLRRFMRLTMTRLARGGIQFEGRIDRVESQTYLSLLDRSMRRTQQQLTLCSCCKRALIEPSGWLSLEDAAAQLNLFETRAAPRLRQRVCPECAANLGH